MDLQKTSEQQTWRSRWRGIASAAAIFTAGIGLGWSAPTLAANAVVQIANGANCVANWGWSTSAGNLLGLAPCKNQGDMTFDATVNADNTITFANSYSKLCVDVAGNSQSAGAKIQQDNCTAGNPRISAIAMGSDMVKLVFQNSNLCLQQNFAGQAGLSQENCSGAANQSFKLNVVSGKLPAPVANASPNGTLVPPASQIIDAKGNKWTIIGDKVGLNGVADPVTGWVTTLLYYGGMLYQKNSGNNWYAWTGSGWSGAMADPRTTATPQPSANGTLVPPASQIIDSKGNKWTIIGDKVGLNGVADPVTGWVTTLLYYGGTLYQKNSGNNWYAWTGSGWSAPMNDPRGTTAPPPSSGALEIGIQNMGITWSNFSTINAIYDGMARDLPGLDWIRADIQDDDPNVISNYVQIVRKAKEKGFKVLALFGPTALDVGGGTFPYRLSAVNQTRLRTRLLNYINAIKAAGLSVDAFEVGNELDSTGFNADNPKDINLFRSAYGAFLKTSLDVIKSSQGFPNAKVITVGFANMMDYCPECHLDNPPAALAGLRNYNGENLLARVDGYGFHVYPLPSTIQSQTGRILQQYKDAGLGDKPVWITEWGFWRVHFPYNGHPRSWAMDQFLQYVSTQTITPRGPVFLFNYRGDAAENYVFDIYDGNTIRQDEANVIINWSNK